MCVSDDGTAVWGVDVHGGVWSCGARDNAVASVNAHGVVEIQAVRFAFLYIYMSCTSMVFAYICLRAVIANYPLSFPYCTRRLANCESKYSM